MDTFFYGWRRKAGAVALVVALTVFGMWMRSRIVNDLIEVPLGYLDLQFFSSGEAFAWSVRKSRNGRLSWTTFSSRDQSPPDGLEFGTHYVGLIVTPIVLSFWLLLWKPLKRS